MSPTTFCGRGVCAPSADGAAGELEAFEAALDAPGVTPEEVRRLLVRALGRDFGSVEEEWARIGDALQGKETWLGTFCRSTIPTAWEERVRAEVRRLRLDSSLIAAAIERVRDLRNKHRPAGLPTFEPRRVACVASPGVCEGGAGDLWCELQAGPGEGA